MQKVLLTQKLILVFFMMVSARLIYLWQKDLYSEDEFERIINGRSASNRNFSALTWVTALVGAVITAFATSWLILILGLVVYFGIGVMYRSILLECTAQTYYDYQAIIQHEEEIQNLNMAGSKQIV